jgi:hypothetical protein
VQQSNFSIYLQFSTFFAPVFTENRRKRVESVGCRPEKIREAEFHLKAILQIRFRKPRENGQQIRRKMKRKDVFKRRKDDMARGA